MKSPTDGSRSKARILWILVTLAVLAVLGGVGYRYTSQQTTALAKAAAPEMTTRKVRTGSITLATSGTVSLVPSQETSLGFTVSGTVAELNAAPGDTVKKGQVLAQLDNLDELGADIRTAEQDLASARLDLAAIKAKAPANLANAQLAVITAQEALSSAQSSEVKKDSVRCSQDTKDKLLSSYNRAVDQLNALGDGGGSADYYLKTILPQKQKADQALGAYQSCGSFTDYQVASSQANVVLAQANLNQAQAALDTLTKNEGLNPSDLAAAENKVTSAELALEKAQNSLAGATLTAPFDGTLLTVAGKVGDLVEVSTRNPTVTWITLADLAHPLLKFSIDETDLSMAAPGEEAIITFDAFPNRAFHGKVTRVDPALTTGNDSSMVTGLIQMDLSQETDVPVFPKSLSGSVQILQDSAEGVLLVPLEALQKQADGSYSVYVLGQDGQPVLTPVKVGLMDAASAEIKSGLTAGDVVVTNMGESQ